jgi:hypothetical protein
MPGAKTSAKISRGTLNERTGLGASAWHCLLGALLAVSSVSCGNAWAETPARGAAPESASYAEPFYPGGEYDPAVPDPAGYLGRPVGEATPASRG